MKKIFAATALIIMSTTPMMAHAGQSSGYNTSHESGVTVYRGNASQPNLQAATAFKALELQELQIKNEANLRQQQIRSENAIAQQRINIDRRIAFAPNNIFDNQRSFGRRGFITSSRPRFEFNSLSGFSGRRNIRNRRY